MPSCAACAPLAPRLGASAPALSGAARTSDPPTALSGAGPERPQEADAPVPQGLFAQHRGQFPTCGNVPSMSLLPAYALRPARLRREPTDARGQGRRRGESQGRRAGAQPAPRARSCHRHSDAPRMEDTGMEDTAGCVVDEAAFAMEIPQSSGCGGRVQPISGRKDPVLEQSCETRFGPEELAE